jgi:hypothetical protein
MRFCAPSAYPRSQQQHQWPGLPHPSACALRFSQPLDAFRSTASLPALFRAGSAHGIAPFRAFLLPRGRTPSSGADPLLALVPTRIHLDRLVALVGRSLLEPPDDRRLPSRAEAPSFQQLPPNPPSRPKPVRKVRRALPSADARRLRRTVELLAGAAPEGSVQRTSARSAANPRVLGGPDTPPACAATRRSMARFERLHSLPIETEVPFGKHGGRNPDRPEPKLLSRRTSRSSRESPERLLCSGRLRLPRRGPKTTPSPACSPSASSKSK